MDLFLEDAEETAEAVVTKETAAYAIDNMLLATRLLNTLLRRYKDYDPTMTFDFEPFDRIEPGGEQSFVQLHLTVTKEVGKV